MEIKGIDVSHNNGKIDWEKVKESGIKFAMLRAGYGVEDPDQIDREFERNYRECKRLGIPVGAYHFSYAQSAGGAKKELDFFLKLIKNKQFEYPVCFDLEDKTQINLPKNILTDMVITFCDGLEKAGYYAALYSNPDWLVNRLDRAKIARFDLWLAQWSKKKTYTGAHGIWQYSGKGAIPGISGNVDLDVAYKDYPTLIKNKKLNGFGSKPKTYSLTATQKGLKKDKADETAVYLQKLGMTVIVKED